MLRQNNNEKLRPNATQIYGWPFKATKDPVWPLDHIIFLFAFRQNKLKVFLCSAARSSSSSNDVNGYIRKSLYNHDNHRTSRLQQGYIIRKSLYIHRTSTPKGTLRSTYVYMGAAGPDLPIQAVVIKNCILKKLLSDILLWCVYFMQIHAK